MKKIYVDGNDELLFNLEKLDCEIFNDNGRKYIDESQLDKIFDWIINMVDDINLVKELLNVNIYTKVEFELNKSIYDVE